MIYVITNENFMLLDRKIEKAYRRRCEGPELPSACVCLRNMECAALLESAGEAQRSNEEGRAWLSRLAQDVEALAQGAQRRRLSDTRMVAANTKKPARPSAPRGKRRRAVGA